MRATRSSAGQLEGLTLARRQDHQRCDSASARTSNEDVQLPRVQRCVSPWSPERGASKELIACCRPRQTPRSSTVVMLHCTLSAVLDSKTTSSSPSRSSTGELLKPGLSAPSEADPPWTATSRYSTGISETSASWICASPPPSRYCSRQAKHRAFLLRSIFNFQKAYSVRLRRFLVGSIH